eukprot:PLAT13428.1.p1 GENE.PLAT13428.1~~PLAT13428.1.p1  ORF type:complete len:506 (-),score=195.91 PLAT13428.1:97-1587(-)
MADFSHCSACGSRFADTAARRPLCLVCGHTFCATCVQKRLDDEGGGVCVPCFDCDRSTPAESGTIDDIGVNHLLLQLLQQLAVAAAAAAPPPPLCGFCAPPDVSDASLWCSSCQADLCKGCSSELHSRRCFSSHTVVPLSEKVSEDDDSAARGGAYGARGGRGGRSSGRGRGERKVSDCPEHRGEPQILYCCTCEQSICAYCEKYGDHRRHRIIGLKEVGKRKMKQMAGMIDALEAMGDASAGTRRMESELRMLKEVYSKQVAELESTRDSIPRLLSSLEALSHKSDAALIFESGSTTRAAVELVTSMRDSVEQMYKYPELRAFLPKELKAIRKTLALACGHSGADLTWDITKISPSYGCLYTVSEEGRRAEKTASDGTIINMACKETMKPGDIVAVRIVKIGNISQDHEIGLIDSTHLHTVLPSCWMQSSPHAWYEDFRSWAPEDVVEICFGGPGAETTFSRNGDVVKTVSLGAHVKEVYLTCAMRSVGSAIIIE